jgi:hypothetical protein
MMMMAGMMNAYYEGRGSTFVRNVMALYPRREIIIVTAGRKTSNLM